MTNLLVKLFIKDYEQAEKTEVRTRYGVLASLVGVILNILLFLVKLFIGLAITSISVMADAFNNLSDAASSIIGLVGAKIAERPADKEHPFGHGRAEYISAFIIAFLILQVGFSCFKSAVTKVLHPEAILFKWVLVGILVLSVLVKLWLSIFNKKLGDKINSSVLKATAADAMGDVAITSATIASLFISKYTGLQVDGYMGIVVSVFVLLAGYNIAKETLEPLLGTPVEKEVYDSITYKIENYEGILGSHDLIVHNYGPNHVMATIHAEVPNNTDMEEAHEIIDQIERDVLRDMGIFLVIHMDPVEVNDVVVLETKRQVIALIEHLEPKGDIHDFRLVNGEHHVNLIFDLVVPYSYTKEKEEELQKRIKEEMKKIDKKYECIITIENSYISE